MITNSYSDFKFDTEKISAYVIDAQKTGKHAVVAYKSDGTSVPLKNCDVADVEFVAGAWRVQDKFKHKIENVRGKAFVIGEKLPHVEHTLFDFYRAYSVGENCYGKYKFEQPDFIVAKYFTKHGTYTAYGKTIEDARAYLGIKLYDEYQDIIHNAINTQKPKTK